MQASVIECTSCSYNFSSRAIWKRRISIFRRTSKTDEPIYEFLYHIDNLCRDVKGWLELADVYVRI